MFTLSQASSDTLKNSPVNDENKNYHRSRVGVKERHAVCQFGADERLIVIIEPLTTHCAPIVAEIILNCGCFHLEIDRE
jgi:hypothetical protein